MGIVWSFDAHACTLCRGRHRHRVGHVLVDPDKQFGDFMLVCTNCGESDGPVAGPRARDQFGFSIPRKA